MRTAVLGVDCVAGELLAGVDHDGHRHLLVPLTHLQRLRGRLDGANLRFTETPLETDDDYRRYADVYCVERQLDQLFSEVCVDVLEAVEARPNQALAATNEVLATWRSLFAPSNTVLRTSALAGLFGELVMLRDLLSKTPSAALMWHGPAGERHDFTSGKIAVEVKTTTRPDGRAARIHGLDQLNPPMNGRLHLRWIRVAQESDGESVPDLVRHVLAATDDPPTVHSMLAEVGFRLSDDSRYESIRFRIVEDDLLTVTDGFPRLLAATAGATAIRDVEYTIDVPEPGPSHPDIDAVLTEMAEEFVR